MKMETGVKIMIGFMSVAFFVVALLGTEQSALQPKPMCLTLIVIGGILNWIILWKSIKIGGVGSNLVAFGVYAIFLLLAAASV